MNTHTSSLSGVPVFAGARPMADVPSFMAALEHEFPDIPSHKIYEAYESVIETAPDLVSKDETLKARVRVMVKKTGST